MQYVHYLMHTAQLYTLYNTYSDSKAIAILVDVINDGHVLGELVLYMIRTW